MQLGAFSISLAVKDLQVSKSFYETLGFSASGHIDSLAQHAAGVRLDVVLADPGVVREDPDLHDAVRRVGAELVVAPVAGRTPGQHDLLRLAAAYRDLLLGH